MKELLHSTRELHPGSQHRAGLAQTLRGISCCLRAPVKLTFNPNGYFTAAAPGAALSHTQQNPGGFGGAPKSQISTNPNQALGTDPVSTPPTLASSPSGTKGRLGGQPASFTSPPRPPPLLLPFPCLPPTPPAPKTRPVAKPSSRYRLPLPAP